MGLQAQSDGEASRNGEEASAPDFQTLRLDWAAAPSHNETEDLMHVRDLEHWLKAKPFEPFLMQLSNGEKVRVNHPDAAIPGTNAVLVIDKRNGRLRGFSHVSLFHVVRIEPANGIRPRQSRE